MTSRKLILAAVAIALCGGLGWRLVKSHLTPDRPLSALEKMEAKADWNDPVAQAGLAIRLVTEARRTGDPAQWDRAAMAAQRSLARDPERMDAKKVELLVMQNQHRFQELEAGAGKLLEKHPMDGFLDGLVGDAQMEMGQYGKAGTAYQKMVDERPDAATYGRVAYLRLLEGDLDGAIEMGQLAARSAPQTDGDAVAWALSDLGDVYFAREQPDRALEYFDTALKYQPKYSRALEGKGHALHALGKLDPAIAAYRMSVEIAPTGQHRSSLAQALAEAGQTAQAQDQYAQAEKAAQGDTRLLATLLLNEGKDSARALTLAQEEFQRRQDVFTEDVLAYALLRNGKVAEAAQASAHALRLGTRDARLSFHAAAIAAAQGDVANARRRYTESLALAPPLPSSQAAEARQFLAEHKSEVVAVTQPTSSRP